MIPIDIAAPRKAKDSLRRLSGTSSFRNALAEISAGPIAIPETIIQKAIVSRSWKKRIPDVQTVITASETVYLTVLEIFQ